MSKRWSKGKMGRWNERRRGTRKEERMDGRKEDGSKEGEEKRWNRRRE